MKKRLTPDQAGKLIDAPGQLIRVLLQQGNVSWGTALKRSSRYTYYINLDRFCEEYRLNPNEVAAKLANEMAG